MRFRVQVLVFIAFVSLFAAMPARASVEIVDWNDVAAVTSSGAPATAEQIRKAFMVGGARRGWLFSDAGPGQMTATLNVRTHTLVMDVIYSDGKYSLKYRSSNALDYEVVDGKPTIHRNYIRWNNYLQQDVRAELLRL